MSIKHPHLLLWSDSDDGWRRFHPEKKQQKHTSMWHIYSCTQTQHGLKYNHFSTCNLLLPPRQWGLYVLNQEVRKDLCQGEIHSHMVSKVLIFMSLLCSFLKVTCFSDPVGRCSRRLGKVTWSQTLRSDFQMCVTGQGWPHAHMFSGQHIIPQHRDIWTLFCPHSHFHFNGQLGLFWSLLRKLHHREGDSQTLFQDEVRVWWRLRVHLDQH